MRISVWVLLVFLATVQLALAGTITSYPLGSAAGTSSTDVMLYVDVPGNLTKKMLLSDIKNIPALAAAIAGGGGSSGLVVSATLSSSATVAAGSPVNYKHIPCDATSGAVVATIPLCAGNVGQAFNLKKIDSSGNSCGYLASGSDLIDGQASISNSNQYVGMTIVCRAAGFWDRF